MSEFTTELIVEQIGETQYYILLEGFEYHVGEYPSDEIITVPKGFITDFASVPKCFHWIIPPRGRYGKAAVIHDYCYFSACYSKLRSDQIFLEGMEVLNVPKWKRNIMYYAVVFFGWYGWYKARTGQSQKFKEDILKEHYKN